jgi:hypothetical protein
MEFPFQMKDGDDGDNSDPMSVALLCCMVELGKHPGTFNPDVGQFESGLQGLLKRLGVASVEDSWMKDGVDCLHLWGCTKLKKAIRHWQPPNRDWVIRWFQIALRALEQSAFVFVWDTTHAYPTYDLSPTHTNWQNAAALLRDLKSLPEDLVMLDAIATNPQGCTRSVTNYHRPPKMSFTWPFDHHTTPSIGWLLKPVIDEKKKEDNVSSPFADTFSDLFRNGTGLNPRRTSISMNSPPIQAIQAAQATYWKWISSPTTVLMADSKQTTTTNITLEYDLHSSWIGAGIGTIPITLVDPVSESKDEFWVTLKTNNIREMVVMQRPRSVRSTNTMPNLVISSDDQKRVIDEAMKRLTTEGVKWKGTRPPIAEYSNKTIRWDAKHNDYLLDGQLWDTVRHLSLVIPCFKANTWQTEWKDMLSSVRVSP